MRRLEQRDALEGLRSLAPGSVGLLLTDMPYGATRADWDRPVDLPVFWAEARRVLRPGGVAVLFAAGRFLATLLASNPAGYRYDLVWVKGRASGHLNAWRRPMAEHENLLVFIDEPGRSVYRPQFRAGAPYRRAAREAGASRLYGPQYALRERGTATVRHEGSVLHCPKPPPHPGRHPTEKPVELLRHLIELYTDPGDLVVDPYAGRASTLVAALQAGRGYAGFETCPEFFAAAERRMREEEARVPDVKLPNLEDLIRMDSHPAIGTLEKIEEVTAQEFVRLTLKVPRREWRWHDRDPHQVGGLFSVPRKFEMRGTVRHPYPGDERLYWQVEPYTEGGQRWLRLTRKPAPPEALLTPDEPQVDTRDLWLRHETGGAKEG